MHTIRSVWNALNVVSRPTAKVTLTAEVLDRIDEIVPPGTDLNPADAGYLPPSLIDAHRRRR